MAQVDIAAGKRRRNGFGAFVKDSKGATVVEFALIATPFFAILAALIQTFLLFFAQSVLENVVRQSARQLWLVRREVQGLSELRPYQVP